MKIRWLVSLAAVLLVVAACESAPDTAGLAADDGSSTSANDTGGTDASADASIESSNVETQVASIDSSAPIPGTQEDLVQNVGDRVFFALDSAVLSPQSRGVLERQAEWLGLFPDARVTIEGHCDERGTREYNLALGERRASAARSYLMALGIDGNRLEIISYGKERPYALGHNGESWNLNRRSVSVVN